MCIEEYSATIAESAEVGSQILRIVATDADSGSFGEITYTIIMGNEVKLIRMITERTGH